MVPGSSLPGVGLSVQRTDCTVTKVLDSSHMEFLQEAFRNHFPKEVVAKMLKALQRVIGMTVRILMEKVPGLPEEFLHHLHLSVECPGLPQLTR